MNAKSQKSWKVADAKKEFSKMLRQAARAPQLIFNRERLVAVVLDPATFEKLDSLERERANATLAEAFEELRTLCSEEAYALEVPLRGNRINVFAEALDDVSR